MQETGKLEMCNINTTGIPKLTTGDNPMVIDNNNIKINYVKDLFCEEKYKTLTASSFETGLYSVKLWIQLMKKQKIYRLHDHKHHQNLCTTSQKLCTRKFWNLMKCGAIAILTTKEAVLMF